MKQICFCATASFEVCPVPTPAASRSSLQPGQPSFRSSFSSFSSSRPLPPIIALPPPSWFSSQAVLGSVPHALPGT